MHYVNVNVNLMVENIIQIKYKITRNVNASARIQKSIMLAKKNIQNPAPCSCENGKYLASSIDHTVITCEEIIDTVVKSYDKEAKTVPTI